MSDLPLFLEKNYGRRLASAELASQSNEVVHLVQTVDNQRFGLKIYRSSGAPSAGRLAVVGAFLQFLSEKKWPVQVPVPTVGGEAVSSIFWEGKERTASLYRWLDGQKVSRTFSEPGAKKGGATLARFHLAAEVFSKKTGNGPAVFQKAGLTVLDEHFVESTARWLAAELPAYGFSKKKEVAALSQKLDWLAGQASFFEKKPASFGLVHSDLHRSNLLRVGRRLTAIDWDEAAIGPFLLDAAVFLDDFQNLLPEKRSRRIAAFWEGYRSEKEPPTHFEENMAAARAMVGLLFVSWAYHPQNGHVRAAGGRGFAAIAGGRLRQLLKADDSHF